jgi:DNA replication protein DnaC
MTPSDQTRLETQLQRLQLRHFKSHYQTATDKAAEQQRSHVDYLAQLVDGETALRESRSIERRIRNARFPVLKTLEDFQWSWPRKINRPQIQNRFRLAFITTHTKVVLIGNVGLGKTHLSVALGHAACLNGHSVLFTTAVDIVNTLAAAQAAGSLKRELARYLKPPFSSSMNSATCPSTSKAPTCCSRSSASATSAPPWSSPPTAPTNTGRRSSTTTAP